LEEIEKLGFEGVVMETKDKINVLFNIKDVAIIDQLPNFVRIFEYPTFDNDYPKYEWGKINIRNHSQVCFQGFSELGLDAKAAFTGQNGSIKEESLTPIRGALRISNPDLQYLMKALQIIMGAISNNMTKYPPHFKIWTEITSDFDLVIRYEVL